MVRPPHLLLLLCLLLPPLLLYPLLLLRRAPRCRRHLRRPPAARPPRPAASLASRRCCAQRQTWQAACPCASVTLAPALVALALAAAARPAQRHPLLGLLLQSMRAAAAAPRRHRRSLCRFHPPQPRGARFPRRGAAAPAEAATKAGTGLSWRAAQQQRGCPPTRPRPRRHPPAPKGAGTRALRPLRRCPHSMPFRAPRAPGAKSAPRTTRAAAARRRHRRRRRLALQCLRRRRMGPSAPPRGAEERLARRMRRRRGTRACDGTRKGDAVGGD